MSNNVNINGATDRTSIKCHKIYNDNRESLNKRLSPESYFMRNILDLSAIMALLKPKISWIITPAKCNGRPCIYVHVDLMALKNDIL